MSMRNKYLLNLAHLHSFSILNLLLCRFSAIKQPYLRAQSQSQRGMVPCRRWLRRRRPQECDIERGEHARSRDKLGGKIGNREG